MLTEQRSTKRRAKSIPSRAEKGSQPARLPIDQIYPMYPGEWVLVKVTGPDGEYGETHGEVVAHDRSRKRISKHVIRCHEADPTVRTYVFYGGYRGTSGDEWAELLAEAARLGPLNVKW